jgi:hypothetical protein
MVANAISARITTTTRNNERGDDPTQEVNLVTYNVGLCRMANGSLDAPYEGASIEAANIPDALLKAKKWAASVEVADNSWLQILLDGRSVRSLKPGSF